MEIAMPRDGSGVYSKPAGTTAVPNTTIESDKYNSTIDDLVTDANAARPRTAGGTGVTSIADFKTTYNLTIGTDVQAYDAGLTSIAGLTTVADRMIYTTASDTYAVTALTAFARTLLDDADASTVLSTLGFSTFAKTIIDDADASAVRTTIGANSATNLTTGTVNKDRLPTLMNATAFDGDITIQDNANKRILFLTDAGVVRAVIYHDATNDALRHQLYNSSGVLVLELYLAQNGTILWNSSPVWTTAYYKSVLAASGVPAGYIHTLGQDDSGNYRIMRIDKSTGAVTVTATGW